MPGEQAAPDAQATTDEQAHHDRALDEAHRILDAILREQHPQYRTPWEPPIIARFGRHDPEPEFGPFADRDAAFAFADVKRRALCESIVQWLADARVRSAVADQSAPSWPLRGSGHEEACTELTVDPASVAVLVKGILELHGHEVQKWAWCLSVETVDAWLGDVGRQSEAYRQDARRRIERAQAERERAEDEARYLETARTLAGRIDALDHNATVTEVTRTAPEENADAHASDGERPGDGARTDHEEQTDAGRRALWEELRAVTDGCPHYVAGNALHAAWLRLAHSIEERIAVYLSWHRVCSTRIERRATMHTWAEEREREDARAELRNVEGRLRLLRHERTLQREAVREREAAADAALRQRAGGGLLLAMPLISLARQIEALRLAGTLPRSVPLSDVSEHIWVRDSDARNRGASLTASRAKMRSSNATDEHARTFVLALFYLLPPKQREELAAELTRIVRGVPPPEWEHYAE